jgi:hypothetical protein
LATANKEYNGNLAFNRCDKRGNGFVVTLKVRRSKEHGARTSASGRHGPYASWEAHRDFMLALYDLAPGAWIDSKMASYHGVEGFRENFPETRYHQVGSMMQPVSFGELTV